MNSSAGGFIWYELMTTDADAAARFYGPVVGWTISGKAADQPGGVDYRQIVRSNGGVNGGVLNLTAEMCEQGASPCWVGYIHVDDVDKVVEAILADGGMQLIPKMTIEVGSFAMVTDPQGVPFYVMSPIPPADNPQGKSDVFDPETPQHIRWNELMTSDADAGLAFYRKHFGWGQEGEMPMGELGSYRFIQHGDTAIGAVMGQMPGTSPVWTYYIGVDDIDRAAAAVTAGGGTVTHGPDEIPGGEFAMTGIDPQAAAFGLVGPRIA
jgi:predicted enzyme related to lactoylglutathione lyase